MPVYSTPDIAPAVKAFETRLRGRMKAWMASRTPSGFRETELEIAAASRSLADEITAAVLIAMTEDMEWQEQVSGRAREHGPYRGGGQRPVTVTLLGGTRVTVRSIYLKPDRRGQRGRPRGVGRRGQGGSGLYPALAALGIWFAVSPGAALEVCRQVADSDSVRAGSGALARRDLDLGHKQTLRIVNRVGQRIVTQRSSWMERVIDGPAPDNGYLSGRRVVISTDGGRLRERVPTRGRRREATPTSLTQRLGRITGGAWSNAPSEVTGMHRELYAQIAGEFAGILERLRPLLETELARLEDAAEAAGAPWTSGRLPQWRR